MRSLEEAGPAAQGGSWTYLTNHTHVLVCLAADPTLRLRDVALRVGITERAVQKIVHDLEDVGVLSRFRHGRRNRYAIHPDHGLRHPVEGHCKVRDLLEMVGVRYTLQETRQHGTPAV
jgi:predicted transcriptional regulator